MAGLVVSARANCFEDPSSNPADVYNSVKIARKSDVGIKGETGVGPTKKLVIYS